MVFSHLRFLCDPPPACGHSAERAGAALAQRGLAPWWPGGAQCRRLRHTACVLPGSLPLPWRFHSGSAACTAWDLHMRAAACFHSSLLPSSHGTPPVVSSGGAPADLCGFLPITQIIGSFLGYCPLQPSSLSLWQGQGAACGASVFPCSSSACATAWERGRRCPGFFGRAFCLASLWQGSLVLLLWPIPASSGQWEVSRCSPGLVLSAWCF